MVNLAVIKRGVIVAIILIVFITLVVNCRGNIITALGGYTDEDFVTKIDTEYLPVKIDTTAVFNHYVETRGIILNPDPEIKYKYKIVKEYIKDTVVVDSTKYFSVAVKDSLIDGTIHVVNNFEGDLLDAYFRYKPLFPKYIEKRIPIKVTETKYVNTQGILFGVGGRVNNLGHIGGHAAFMTKNRWDFRVGYNSGRVIENSFNTDDYISIDITKYFKW